MQLSRTDLHCTKPAAPFHVPLSSACGSCQPPKQDKLTGLDASTSMAEPSATLGSGVLRTPLDWHTVLRLCMYTANTSFQLHPDSNAISTGRAKTPGVEDCNVYADLRVQTSEVLSACRTGIHQFP